MVPTPFHMFRDNASYCIYQPSVALVEVQRFLAEGIAGKEEAMLTAHIASYNRRKSDAIRETW